MGFFVQALWVSLLDHLQGSINKYLYEGDIGIIVDTTSESAIDAIRRNKCRQRDAGGVGE
jgi:hypothetical protein